MLLRSVRDTRGGAGCFCAAIIAQAVGSFCTLFHARRLSRLLDVIVHVDRVVLRMLPALLSLYVSRAAYRALSALCTQHGVSLHAIQAWLGKIME
jgi:hypothetical protein